jgi:Fic/DOC family
MAAAIGRIGPGDPVTVDVLLGFHRQLLSGTRLEANAGSIRAEQKTIHPFVDGNGRTGRALIQMTLRRHGLATRVLLPISLVLATWSDDYARGLQENQVPRLGHIDGGPGWTHLWVGRSAAACRRAVTDAAGFEQRVRQLEESWRARLGPVRADSAADILLRMLPGVPIITVNSATALIGRSFKAGNDAIARLVEVGILRQVSVGRRNRAFEAPDVIDEFTALERQLASPGGDTRISSPARRVPRRLRSLPAPQSRAHRYVHRVGDRRASVIGPLGNAHVVVLVGALDVARRQVRLGNSNHGGPMPSCRAPLRPGVAKSQRLEGKTGDPDRGEQVAFAASHNHTTARPTLAPECSSRCPHDHYGGNRQHYQRRCAHTSTLVGGRGRSRAERPGKGPAPRVFPDRARCEVARENWLKSQPVAA